MSGANVFHATRRALHVSVGVIDVLGQRRREFQGQLSARLDEIAKRGEHRLHGRGKASTKTSARKT